MTEWRLKRVRQCDKCPWKVSTNPHDIPRGYTVEKHKALENTIAKDLCFGTGTLNVMHCHETDDAHCIGWLKNQLGRGNNIPLRLTMMSCTNADKIETIGEQHECFEDTLPLEDE